MDGATAKLRVAWIPNPDGSLRTPADLAWLFACPVTCTSHDDRAVSEWVKNTWLAWWEGITPSLPAVASIHPASDRRFTGCQVRQSRPNSMHVVHLADHTRNNSYDHHAMLVQLFQISPSCVAGMHQQRKAAAARATEAVKKKPNPMISTNSDGPTNPCMIP